MVRAALRPTVAIHGRVSHLERGCRTISRWSGDHFLARCCLSLESGVEVHHGSIERSSAPNVEPFGGARNCFGVCSRAGKAPGD
jgi:hypothetical protein